MSFIGEAALSAVIDALFGKLSDDLLKTFRKENFDADLKKWKRMLLKIRAVLDDAEEKQVTSASVKFWLDELEGLAYDVDDILDEFATEALRRELNPEPKSKMQKVLDGYVGSNRDFVKLMRSKIEGIDRRLQEIVDEKKDLELRENTGRRTITKTSRPPSTSLVNESRTYGRDEDKKKIVKLLLESSGAQLSVIPIVGMGGLGKTTLAQLVYDEVSRHFELKAWVCVSEDFDNLRLTKEILHSFTSESCHDNNNLDSLQGKLKNTLSGKKFLLVLDDVWNENYELWTELCKPFESGAQGSKIVVTTRNDGVSSIMGTNPPYKLKELSRDACLRVFTHHALDATDFSEYPELEKYGQKIVDRCNGAPLAAKALGGLLRSKHDPCEWEDVLNSKIWDIPEDKSSIFSVLKLSYNYLPSHLKRCFAYCSLFPKDNQFEKKELVLLWMGEGLVQETKGRKPLEDLGGEYLHDLLKRSFFQQSSYYESRFVMHDLMHDLAQWAAGDLCYRLDVQLGGSKQSEISTKVRHFSYIKHSTDCIQMFDEDVHLRTFLSLPLYKQRGLTNFDVKYCSFPQLRCLRVLSLSGNDIFKLPSSIGDLIHLRYLNLSYTKIAILPESTSSLYNLQTLMLKGCDSLTKLPEKIENLVNLRRLEISGANSITEMPAGIAKLKSLRTLFFEELDEWQDWIPCRVEGEEFPCLRELLIFRCPKLGKFSYHLPSLERLFIHVCEQLVVSIPSHSMIQELKFVKCKEIALGYVKVEKLIIKNCEKLMSLCEDGHMSFVTPPEIKIKSCHSLVNLKLKSTFRTLTIKSCHSLVNVKLKSTFRTLTVKSCHSLVNIRLKSTFRTLTIKGCSALESLQFVTDEVGASSTSSLLMNEENLSCIGNNNASLLEHLEISDCPSLTPEIKIKSCHSLVNIKLKSTFRKLTIKGCIALESLQFVTDEVGAFSTSSLLMNEENLSCIGNNNASLLEHLEISDCPSLKCLSTIVDLAIMLKRLDIKGCRNLTSLSSRDTLPTTLKVLKLGDCPKLESIVDKFNKDTLLEHLLIHRCEKLRCLPRGLHKLCHLEVIYIYECKSLISLGDLLPTNLRSLEIQHCEKLEALPNNIHNLNFLQDLSICDCPSIVSFPEEGFPTNLRELCLSGANLFKQVFELGLHRLTSLTSLKIANGIMAFFPEEEDGKTMLILPTSLTQLRFESFPTLLFLSWKFFQNLSKLEEISIGKCPELASLSQECFPPSLQRLKIYNCPVLEQNCKEFMWSKIVNIHSVIINGKEQQKFFCKTEGFSFQPLFVNSGM